MVSNLSSKQMVSMIIAMDMMVVGSAFLRGLLTNLDFKQQFAEKGYVSFFSFLQILLVAILAGIIFYLRKSAVRRKSWKSSYNLWAFISIGFVFFGIDEYFEVHESIDFLIHYVFNIQETPITDRIDSLIVLMYALIGSLILYLAKSELKLFKSAFSSFKQAIIFLSLMLCLDLITDSKHFANWLFVNPQMADAVHNYLGAIEEACKIFAGGFLIATVYDCLQISKKQSLK